MSGFFTNKEIQSESKRKLSCYQCGLYKGNIKNPKMKPFGNFAKKILCIGEFTNSDDDFHNKPFQGKERGVVRTLRKFGIDLWEDCISINSVMCYAGEEREPAQKEIDCCRINVYKVIREYKPKLILLFGKISLESVIGDRWKDNLGGIDKWRGFVIPDQDFKCWIAPLFSASYVKMYDKEEVYTVWEQDIENALSYLDTDFPFYKEPTIRILEDDLSILTAIRPGDIVSIDYETTGLKPHDEGHRIVCISVAVNANLCYVFEMPKTRKALKPFLEVLTNPLIKKSAHNMKFEHTWSLIRLGVEIQNWFFDTMIAAHIIDNRQSITGLKFQTYVNFGIVNYNMEVEKWLQATDDKNANSKNRLLEYFATPMGKRETLKYCGKDTIHQYRLMLLQLQIIDIF